jgi:hypothetical protein
MPKGGLVQGYEKLREIYSLRLQSQIVGISRQCVWKPIVQIHGKSRAGEIDGVDANYNGPSLGSIIVLNIGSLVSGNNTRTGKGTFDVAAPFFKAFWVCAHFPKASEGIKLTALGTQITELYF